MALCDLAHPGDVLGVERSQRAAVLGTVRWRTRRRHLDKFRKLFQLVAARYLIDASPAVAGSFMECDFLLVQPGQHDDGIIVPQFYAFNFQDASFAVLPDMPQAKA